MREVKDYPPYLDYPKPRKPQSNADAPYQALLYGCGINYPHCKEDCYWYKEELDMGAHIPYCQNKGGNNIEPKDCENCEQYHSKYKPTNADKIRAMDDEELAEWIISITEDLTTRWLDWLKQEVE